MPPTPSRSALILAVVAMIVLPLIASWFAYPTTHLPPGFGIFPPLYVENPPGFNLTIFIALALVEIAFMVFLLFPQWFGFKSVESAPEPTLQVLPIWFWLGLSVTLFFWWLMWARHGIW